MGTSQGVFEELSKSYGRNRDQGGNGQDLGWRLVLFQFNG